jgi:hypothetical protein
MELQKNNVDLECWLSMSSLTIREVACLLADIEPFVWSDDFQHEHPKLLKLYVMLTRALEDSELNPVPIYDNGIHHEPRIRLDELKAWLVTIKMISSVSQFSRQLLGEHK